MRLDPSHIGYYKDQRSLVLMDQVGSFSVHILIQSLIGWFASFKTICYELSQVGVLILVNMICIVLKSHVKIMQQEDETRTCVSVCACT